MHGGRRPLLDDAELWLERGEHVSLVGANGAGKTTLIETLAGRRELPAGSCSPATTSRSASSPSTPRSSRRHGAHRAGGHAARHRPDAPRRGRCSAGFLFSGEDAEKPLDGLSGGERRRLSLAVLVHSGANVLILDEPTNHLDLESREALEEALAQFTGSLLLVSHDRALLDAVGTRTVAVEDGACAAMWAAGPSTCGCARSGPRRRHGRPTPVPGAAVAGAAPSAGTRP